MNPQAPANNNTPEVAAPEVLTAVVNESPTAYNNSNAGVQLFHEPGEVAELRALDSTGRARPFLHTDHTKLLEQALELNAMGYNAYHTINPITPSLQSGAASDDHIVSIRWIPGDVDPVRRDADGKVLTGVASTEQEKAASLQVAERLIEWYRMQFGIEPALVDHGNGYCVMAPIELAREDASLVEEFIKAQARMFDTVDAHIDPVCANPSRILRIPGTVNRKGQETAERPHRRAQIVQPGNRDSFLTKEDLLRILPPREEKKTGLVISGGQGVLPEWVEDFLKHSEITFRKRHDYKGGSRWILDLGDKLEFDYCPNQNEHGDPNAPTTQAVFLTSQGIPGFQCAHGHCVDIRWRQFRDYHEQQNVDEGRGHFREEWPEVGDDALIISPEALNDTITKAEALLAKKTELRYFRRGTDLVKPVQHNKKDISGLGRDKESVVVQPVSQHTIVRDVSLHATCVNAKRKPTSFTANFAEHLLDRVRCEETEYRVLDMVTSSPVLLPDGTVLDRAGHKCNVLFVASSTDYPCVPEQPTKADAQRALANFDAIYQNFPFVRVGDEDWKQSAGYAGVLAGVLTLVARPAIPTAPIITASATTRGSGKTKSVEAGVVAAIGHKPTVVSFHNEDEFAKTLVPLLREGDRATLIDNVSIPLSGDMLCSVLTSEEHRARILGQSEQVRLINRSVFFATGNNLAIQGDLTRRAIQIQLDPDCEHPERRRFDFDPVVRASKLHPTLCTAALTALRAYWVAGRPDVLDRPALGSFEEWDRLICGCLVWLGYADPVSTQGAVEDSDPEREANLELLSTWWETLGEPSSLGKIGAMTMSPVRELLGSGEAWNARAAGKRLRALDKKVVGGFKLQSRLLKGARLWYVTKGGKTNPEAAKPVPEVHNPGW